MANKTSGRASFGSLLERSADVGTPTNYAVVPEVTNSTPPGRTTAFEDGMTHESDEATAEHIPTVIDISTMQFDLNFVPTDAMIANLHADQKDQVLRYWRVRLGRNPTKAYQGQAYVASLTPGAAGVRGKLSLQLTLQPTGPWALVDLP